MSGSHDPTPRFELADAPAPPIAVSFDRQPDAALIDPLPEIAAGWLWQLRDETERKDRQIPEFAKRQEATAERTKAQQRLDRLLAHPTTGRFGLSPDDPRSRRAQRDLDRLNAEVARVNATYEATTKAWRASAALLAHIERSLRERPGGTQNDLV